MSPAVEGEVRAALQAVHDLTPSQIPFATWQACNNALSAMDREEAVKRLQLSRPSVKEPA